MKGHFFHLSQQLPDDNFEKRKKTIEKGSGGVLFRLFAFLFPFFLLKINIISS